MPCLECRRTNAGVVHAALAYVAWGLFPLCFHQVAAVSSMGIVLHRTVWSLVGPGKLWEYTALVTDAAYPIKSIAALYRDRADCESGFHKLKNQ